MMMIAPSITPNTMKYAPNIKTYPHDVLGAEHDEKT